MSVFWILPVIVLHCLCSVTWVSGQDDFYFRISPENQSVRSGENVRLRCQVSSQDYVVISWTLDGKPVQNSTRIYQAESDLVIGRVDPILDAGSFVCTATNVSSGFSIASLPATLTILWIGNATRIQTQSAVDLRPHDQLTVFNEGDNITLFCKVEGSPDVQFEWWHNGRKISGPKSKALKKWTINQMTAADSGTYTCSARNSAGTTRNHNPTVIVVRSTGIPQLTQLTQQSVSLVHSAARLFCTFNPSAPVEWMFNNAVLTNSSRYTLSDDGQLIINSVGRESEGWYKCKPAVSGKTIPEYGVHLKMAFLDDFKKSSILPTPTHSDGKLYFAEHATVELTCVVPDGLPSPSVWWEGPQGQQLTVPTTEAAVSVLMLLRIRPEDGGLYTCYSENTVRRQQLKTNLIVTTAPIIQQHPISLSVNEGEEVALSCSFIGTPYPATEIKWLKNGKLISEKTTPPLQGLHNSTLRLAATTSDAGDYSCSVETFGHQSVKTTKATLVVRERLKFNPTPVSKKVELGSTSKVHCRAQGSPSPVVRWVKEGRQYFSWPPHIEDVNGTLHIHGVKAQDRGNYTCIATNIQGIINATIFVDVMVLPHFVSLPDNITNAKAGHTLELHCKAEGEPVPTIQWDKATVLLSNLESERFNVFPNGTLIIHSIELEDAGSYGCTAGNAGGFKRAEVQVIVQGWEYSSNNNKESILKTVFISLGVAAGYMFFSLGLLIWCRCRKRQGKTQNGANGMPANGAEVALLPKHEQTESQLGVLDTMNMPFSNITRGQLIGKGRFGDVLEGQVSGLSPSSSNGTMRVLLRCLSTKDEDLLSEFKRQIDMFQRIQHTNLAAVLGLCREVEPQYLLIECQQYNLKSYMLSPTELLSAIQIESMTLQICRAMQALAHARLVHRDLAARNILISFPGKDQVLVKVSSLGLDKQPFSADYYTFKHQLIPLRWLPHEAVLDDEYSTKSDVWMYACTIWELHYECKQPFNSLTDETILRNLSDQSLQWDASFCQSDSLKNLLARCWSHDPQLRPSFEEMLRILEST